ncbi:MAG: cytochrome c class I [Gammaproteobacteria bacterium]|nr:MAG: cytochrome c class I [Gammaproteobacteria bacterium]TND02244.1 MAG: cytochrome c class I [Gammaproteobacteria bacterium]
MTKVWWKTVAAFSLGTVLSASSWVFAQDGPRVYELYCAMCHNNDMMGAPRYGEKREWRDRLSQGEPTLIEHAINGFNKMPAKGGNGGLSDEDVRDATIHLLSSVK